MRKILCFTGLVVMAVFASSLNAEESLSLMKMPCKKAVTGWGSVGQNKTVDGNQLSVGGKKFEKGYGVHADSLMVFPIPEGAERFAVTVGVDDEAKGAGSIEMIIAAGKAREKQKNLKLQV